MILEPPRAVAPVLCPFLFVCPGLPASGQSPSESVGEGEAIQAPGAYLGTLAWPEAEERMGSAPAVILPFGAGAKEHGNA